MKINDPVYVSTPREDLRRELNPAVEILLRMAEEVIVGVAAEPDLPIDVFTRRRLRALASCALRQFTPYGDRPNA